jgi:hypothetical protein
MQGPSVCGAEEEVCRCHESIIRRVTVWAREGGSIKMELIRARECEVYWTELAHDELQSHDFVNKAISMTNWTTWNSFSRSWSSRVTT